MNRDDPQWPSRSPVEVPLAMLDVHHIKALAIERNDRMRAVSSTTYGTTSVERHGVGLLGEHAVAAWLRALGAEVALTGDDPGARASGTGDILVTMEPLAVEPSTAFVEVKTQRQRDWQGRGPVINWKQMHSGQTDAVVWCVVGDDPWRHPVRIVGWVEVHDLRTDIDDERFDNSYRTTGYRVFPAANDLNDLVRRLAEVRHLPPPTTTPFD